MSVSRPSSVEFTILPATENDCDALAEIEAVANGQTNKGKPESNLPRVIFGPPSKASQDFRAKDLLDKLKNDKFTRMWKAVVNDGNGKEKIAAWAHWYYYTEPQPIEWKDIEWPEPVNSDGANEYIGKAHAIRGKYMSGKKFACRSLPVC